MAGGDLGPGRMVRNRATMAAVAVLWLALGVYAAGIGNARSRAAFAVLAPDAAWTETECHGALRSGLIFGPIAAWEETKLSGFPPDDWTLSCAPTPETERKAGR